MPHARRAPSNHEKKEVSLSRQRERVGVRVGHCGFPPHLNPLPQGGEEVSEVIFYIIGEIVASLRSSQ